MGEKYYSYLYEIASHLNKEFSLPAALRMALEKTVEQLDLQTGWIWLVEQDRKSVYLAASYNLPPALSKHPERLSGWCYCIKRYLSDDIAEPVNISEITCSRLKDIKMGTQGLKFHATVPIITDGLKVGIINLLTKETQQLNDQQLAMLNTVSELIGMAIQRTRLQESYRTQVEGPNLQEVTDRVLTNRLEALYQELTVAGNIAERDVSQRIQRALSYVKELRQELTLLQEASTTDEEEEYKTNELHYPTSPLTPRELEVLGMVKTGLTNKQIAEQLYIAERTVKFHITSILSKLFAKTRTEAVNTALQRGLLGG